MRERMKAAQRAAGLCAALLLMLAPPLAAQTVTASVEETTVGTEESIVYTLEIKGADFSNIVFEPSALPDTEIEVPGLAGRTEYFWRVKALNAAGSSPWSPPFRFMTAARIPAAPTLAAPEGEADGLSGTPLLTWTDPRDRFSGSQ